MGKADITEKTLLDHNYKPSPDTIKHVDETLKLMSILTGDDRFNRAVKAVPDSRKGENSMEAILDRIEARGKEQGEIIGEDNHAIKVYNNCLNRGMSEKDAIAISEISDSALQRARKGRQNKV